MSILLNLCIMGKLENIQKLQGYFTGPNLHQISTIASLSHDIIGGSKGAQGKSREVNVFSPACLSFCLQGKGFMWPLPMMHWISSSTSPPTDMINLIQLRPHSTGKPPALAPVQGPPAPAPASNIWWPRLEIGSNLFTWKKSPVLSSGGCETHHSGMLSCLFGMWLI